MAVIYCAGKHACWKKNGLAIEEDASILSSRQKSQTEKSRRVFGTGTESNDKLESREQVVDRLSKKRDLSGADLRAHRVAFRDERIL